MFPLPKKFPQFGGNFEVPRLISTDLIINQFKEILELSQFVLRQDNLSSILYKENLNFHRSRSIRAILALYFSHVHRDKHGGVISFEGDMSGGKNRYPFLIIDEETFSLF